MKENCPRSTDETNDHLIQNRPRKQEQSTRSRQLESLDLAFNWPPVPFRPVPVYETVPQVWTNLSHQRGTKLCSQNATGPQLTWAIYQVPKHQEQSRQLPVPSTYSLVYRAWAPWLPFQHVHNPEWPPVVLMVNKSTESDLDGQGIKNNKSTSPEYLMHWFCTNWQVCSFSRWCTSLQDLFRVTQLGLGTDGVGWNPGSTTYQLCYLRNTDDLLLLHFISLCFTGIWFLQTEGQTLHQPKDYNSLYCGGLEPDLQYRWGLPVWLNFSMTISWSTNWGFMRIQKLQQWWFR